MSDTFEVLCFEKQRGMAECGVADERLTHAIGQSACATCIVPKLFELSQRNEDLEAENEGLRGQASTDFLTGLHSRLGMREVFDAHRKNGEPMAVLFLDLDRFKRINDLHGHAKGDLVLAAVGLAFRQNLRDEDMFGRIGDDLHGHASRHGGDEFVVVASLQTPESQASYQDRRKPDLTVDEQAELFLDRIHIEFDSWFQKALETLQAKTPKDRRLKIHPKFHAGIAVSDIGDNRSLDELIHLADPDKSEGRARLVPKRVPGASIINRAYKAAGILLGQE